MEALERTDLAATTGALSVLAALTDDELVAARMRRTLRGRRQPMPAWPAGLEGAGVERVRHRADSFRAALGLPRSCPTSGPLALGDPDLLVSRRRAVILDKYAQLEG